MRTSQVMNKFKILKIHKEPTIINLQIIKSNVVAALQAYLKRGSGANLTQNSFKLLSKCFQLR